MGKYSKKPTPAQVRKQRLLLFGAIGCAAAAVILILVLLFSGKESVQTAAPFTPQIDEAAGEWKGLPTEPQETKAPSKGIAIPGYPTITIPADSANVSLPLHNPEGNPCYFTFTLVLDETGEILYESKQVPPNQGIASVTMTRGLPAGEHPATIQIRTNSLEDGTPMNGADMKTVLVAQ